MVGRTHEGLVRDHNEDYIADNVKLGIAVLADGMGGLNAGEVASSMAVHLLMEELITYRLGDSSLPAELDPAESEMSMDSRVVQQVVQMANDAVFHTSQTQPQCKGMGTTIVASLFYDNKLSIAHIGDSRVYRFRDNVLKQVTKDHSFVQELIDKGLLTREEARVSDKKNVVTRALGVAPFVEVDCHEYEAQVDDVYLFCSDGLHDMVPDGDIEQAFIELSRNLPELANYLVELANANGGRDNVSVILIHVAKPYPIESRGGLLERIVNWFE
ncbi:MAG TPA: Stp1/IreP family PP2C-type Ser/Thr phosphatase [Gammaproteobacteria bacterium]|nr:Stp1/IreP family PP2C-type Ser/Thr phosphatase [Gammaproteobacteria bacterium]